MRAGNLDRRVTFQRLATTPGRGGEPTKAWADAFTTWAQVRDVSASERASAPKEMAQRSSTFTIRWRSDVTESMRIVYDGREWDITGIKELGRRGGLEIAAQATEI